MRSELLGSWEFMAINGGTTEGFVRGVYFTFLGRNAEQSAVDYWTGQAGSTTSSRAMAAWRIIRSREGRVREAAALFEQILARSADATGLTFFADRLLNARGIEGVTSDLASSTEAFNEPRSRTRCWSWWPATGSGPATLRRCGRRGRTRPSRSRG